MLKFILTALLLIPSVASADDWTTADSTREATYLVLLATDWAQTRNIARNPTQWYEINPILGKHPHRGKVDIYMAGTALFNAGFARFLPPDYRAVYQYISIGYEAGFVANNYSFGIKAKF